MPGKASDLLFSPGADKTFWSQPIDKQIQALSALNPEKTKGVTREAWQQYIAEKKPQAEQLFGNIGSDKPATATPPNTAPPSTTVPAGKGLSYAASRGAVEGQEAISHLAANGYRGLAKLTGSKYLNELADTDRRHEREDKEWLAAHPADQAAGWMEKLLEGTVSGAIEAIPYAAARGPIGVGIVSAAEHADEGLAPAAIEGVKGAITAKTLGKLSDKLTPTVDKVLTRVGASGTPEVIKRAIAPGTASAIIDYVLSGGDTTSAASSGIIGGVQGSVSSAHRAAESGRATSETTNPEPPRTTQVPGTPRVWPEKPKAASVPTPLIKEAIEKVAARKAGIPPRTSPPAKPAEKTLAEQEAERRSTFEGVPPDIAPEKPPAKTPEQELEEARAENARLKAAGQPPKTAPPKPKKVATTKTEKAEEKPAVTPTPEAKTEPVSESTAETAPPNADTHARVNKAIRTADKQGIGKVTLTSDTGATVDVDIGWLSDAERDDEIKHMATTLGESKEITVTPTEKTKGIKPWKETIAAPKLAAAQFDQAGFPVKDSTGKAKAARRGVEVGDTVTYRGTDGKMHIVDVEGKEPIRLDADSVKKVFGEPEAAKQTQTTGENKKAPVIEISKGKKPLAQFSPGGSRILPDEIIGNQLSDDELRPYMEAIGLGDMKTFGDRPYGMSFLRGMTPNEVLEELNITKNSMAGNPEPTPIKQATPDLTAKLPAPLAKANPRYRYGEKAFTVKFANDLDRAAYITAQPEPSKSDAKYLKFVVDNTGLSEEEIRDHGRDIREWIRKRARGAEPGEIEVSDMSDRLSGEENEEEEE